MKAFNNGNPTIAQENNKEREAQEGVGSIFAQTTTKQSIIPIELLKNTLYT